MPYWKLRVKPHCLTASFDCKRSNDLNWRKPPDKRKAPDGQLSINAERKLKHAIKWLVASSPVKKGYEKKKGGLVDWRVNMATLTFHDNVQDDYLGRKILAQWLEMAKYRFDLYNYVWKAEPQERGAIHFHLITGVYIPHTELKFTWNRLLRKYKMNEITDNSTDIHAVTNAKNLEGYLASYMTSSEKHANRRIIKGRLWGCSQSLSNAGKDYLLIDSDELKSISAEFSKYALENIYISKGKEPPEFLRFNGYWVLPENFYNALPDSELKTLYNDELKALLRRQQKQLFPITE